MPKQVQKTLLLILFLIGLSGARCSGDGGGPLEAPPNPPVKILGTIPSGEKILYAYREPNETHATTIRAMRPDGSGKKDILKARGFSGTWSALSPDGKRLAFEVWDPSGEVVHVYPDGQTTRFGMNWSSLWIAEEGPDKQLRARQITGLKEKNIQSSPDMWSRDGEVLFFSHTGNMRVENVGRPDGWPFDQYDIREDTPEIWSISKDGTNAKKITNGQISSLSPDGKTLAVFRVEGDGYIWGTFLMNTDGSNERLLRKGAVACQWFPDGDNLACLTWLGWGDILIINKNGELIKQLTTGQEVTLPLAISPDGQWIAHQRNTKDIYKMRVDGSSEPILLAGEEVRNHAHTWFWP